MDEKLYELSSDEMTLLIAPDFPRFYQEPRYQTVGFRFGRQGPVYVLKPEIEEYQGKPTENASDFIKRYLMAERERQLDEWARSNPDILPSMTACDTGGLYNLLCSAGEKHIYDPQPTIYWGRLKEGLAVVSLSHENRVCFDFKEQGLTMEDGSPLIRPLFELMNPQHFKLDIVEAQYQSGIRNPGYAELVRINQFLKDADSVRVLLRDGKSHWHQSSFGVRASSFLRLGAERNKLELYQNEVLQSNAVPGISADEIEALLHGDERLDIDTTAIHALFGELAAQGQGQIQQQAMSL